MPPTDVHPSTLLNLISAAVAPVVLITAAAILSSGYSAKYTGIAAQTRALTAEYRDGATTQARRRNLRRQLRLFYRRVTALWAASICLSLSVLSFLMTVLALVFLPKQSRLDSLGSASLVLGLVLLVAGVVIEVYEICLAQLTAAGELEDIFRAPGEEDG